MEKSKIEWTNNTYNPIRLKGGGFYCFKVSPGCTNCYAEIMSRRITAMNHMQAQPYTKRRKYPELELDRAMLASWARKQKSKLNFVSSMSDIFGEFVPNKWVFEILDAMLGAPNQTFQVLTKRARRCYELIRIWMAGHGLTQLPDNIWIMMSVENQVTAEQRIPWLLRIPAKTRGLSIEPLLGLIDLGMIIRKYRFRTTGQFHSTYFGDLIQWVIVGGESGNSARPMHPKWARKIRNQCKEAGVAFFFKQWGQWEPHGIPPVRGVNNGAGIYLKTDGTFTNQGDYWDHNAEGMDKVKVKSHHALLDGAEHKAFPA